MRSRPIRFIQQLLLVRFNTILRRDPDAGTREQAQQGLCLQSLRNEGDMMTISERTMSKRGLTFISVLGFLAGCGADVASTAAASAKLQAMQAEQTKAQEAQFKKKLGEAMQATEAAASAAGNQ